LGGTGNCMTELILASGSPRRAQLLGEMVRSFRIVPGDVDEEQGEGETPGAYVVRISQQKAESVADGLEPQRGGLWVLGGDTIVVLEEAVLGKPEDGAHARRMLEQLQDRRHEVITGICLLNRKQGVCCLEAVRTQVWMRRIEPEEMDAYIRTGEPFDKAGGYAIQGHGGRFIRKIEGSYSNVVGLPMERLGELFRKYGIC
ncbi:MAG: Maf family protein, partial [Thermodesulfobacteriota bacterium]